VISFVLFSLYSGNHQKSLGMKPDKGQLFDTQDRIDRYLKRIWDEVEDKEGSQNFPPNLHSSLIFEWKISVLSNLLSWRHSEILMAESLARQLDANFLLWGVKQPTKIAASWLGKLDSTLVYLSHPISRPRRQKNRGRVMATNSSPI
jgi:hypothetical protein